MLRDGEARHHRPLRRVVIRRPSGVEFRCFAFEDSPAGAVTEAIDLSAHGPGAREAQLVMDATTSRRAA